MAHSATANLLAHATGDKFVTGIFDSLHIYRRYSDGLTLKMEIHFQSRQ